MAPVAKATTIQAAGAKSATNTSNFNGESRPLRSSHGHIAKFSAAAPSPRIIEKWGAPPAAASHDRVSAAAAAASAALPSPVDADRLTGDEAGGFRGEKGDHRRHFVGGAETAHRDRLRALGETALDIARVFAPIGADRPRGADRARQHGVDGDAERREVAGERFREADDGGFRGGIGGAAPARAEG